MLPTVHRLRSRSDFSSVMRARSRAGATYLVVHHAHVGQAPARMGLVIPKAVGGSVVRHRLARRLRALTAARIGSWAPGTDIVIRALPGAGEVDSAQLGADLDRALAKLGIGSPRNGSAAK